MPEAVIAATARSPIGRAFKGSLSSIRPDDLLAQIVTAESRSHGRIRFSGLCSPRTPAYSAMPEMYTGGFGSCRACSAVVTTSATPPSEIIVTSERRSGSTIYGSAR